MKITRVKFSEIWKFLPRFEKKEARQKQKLKSADPPTVLHLLEKGRSLIEAGWRRKPGCGTADGERESASKATHF